MTNLTQAQVLSQTQASIENVNKAFWATNDSNLRTQLTDLLTSLNNLASKLIIADIETRTAEFTDAGNLLKNIILPQINALNASVEQIINADNILKSNVSQLAAMTQASAFFA